MSVQLIVAQTHKFSLAHSANIPFQALERAARTRTNQCWNPANGANRPGFTPGDNHLVRDALSLLKHFGVQGTVCPQKEATLCDPNGLVNLDQISGQRAGLVHLGSKWHGHWIKVHQIFNGGKWAEKALSSAPHGSSRPRTPGETQCWPA